jgi:hypothetical protein
VSLLDRGPHTLVVTPKVEVTDRYGGTTYVDGDPVTVRGSVQPVSTEETEALGVQVDTTYRFIGRDWPGGIHSTVVWDGRNWDQQGEARRYGMSPRTAHVDVILTARGT